MSNPFEYEMEFNFYEEGSNPHSVECGFYRIQYFSNIDIVNQTKMLVDVKGNYYKAYLQTRKGEYYEIDLNVWIDLTTYYDSDKVNIAILFYPDGDLEEGERKDPIITAKLSDNKTYYTVTIKYRGHVNKLYKTSLNPVYQNYSGSFNVYENCTIYAQGKTGDILSNEVSLTLTEVDTTFTLPVIEVSTTAPTNTVTITVTNWGITDSREIEIIQI